MSEQPSEWERGEWERGEWELIRERRAAAFPDSGIAPAKESPQAEQRPDNLVGLALSGGGIRSALYNDGFLQGLSHRGFLRYVDYMASVSGGGYIAGHLTAQADPLPDGAKSPPNEKPDAAKSNAKKSFHDDPHRWKLGRDPDNGQIRQDRLTGIGGYLSRPLDLLPNYLWSCGFNAAFYLGLSGIVATFIALLWRSFDTIDFRYLYFSVLGLTAGNELTVAFIPAMIVLLVYLATGAVFWTLRSAAGVAAWRTQRSNSGDATQQEPSKWRTRLQRWHVGCRKIGLGLLAVALLASVAVFIGNGKTRFQANSQDFFLNHYAQVFAIAAAGVQILVFLGKDRLFRSEQQEAKNWLKHGQRMITAGLIVLAGFAIVHWMAREDISHYTQRRDPHLETGDVTDWYALYDLFESDRVADSANT